MIFIITLLFLAAVVVVWKVAKEEIGGAIDICKNHTTAKVKRRSPGQKRIEKLKARNERLRVDLMNARKLTNRFRDNEVKALLDIDELCSVIERANTLMEQCNEAVVYVPGPWRELRALLREAKEKHCDEPVDEEGGGL